MNTFHLSIYESDGVFYDGECESLVVPTDTGDFGIMANHENIVIAIVSGVMMYRTPEDGTHYASVSDGICVMENNKVTLLCPAIEHPEEIDAERSRQDILEAEETLKMNKSRAEYFSAKSMLARNANRLKVKNKYGSR